MNTNLFPSLKYQKDSGTFHQWADRKGIIQGLSFVNEQDANSFAVTVQSCLAGKTSLVLYGRQKLQLSMKSQISVFLGF